MKKNIRSLMSGMLMLSMVVFYTPVTAGAADVTESAGHTDILGYTETLINNTTYTEGTSVKDTYPDAVYLTFSDGGITSEGGTSGCTINGTALEITSDGTYVVSGECSNGSIEIKKELKVTLVLNGLTLTEPDEGSCPIWSKSDSTLNLVVAEGTTNTLTDASHDGNKPKSCINAGGDLNISGSGTLTVNGNNKNGVKADGSITGSDATIIIKTVGNGLAADNKLTITSGTYKITDGNDGIKAEPETTDNSEDGYIEIKGGTFEIDSSEDGIQAEANVTITGGTFNIKTGGGHTKTISSSDKTSYKAVKAAKYITVYDGDFTIDSADDAFHSDEYVYLIGGTYNISTGDDGAHANTSLIVGEENGKDSDLVININDAYEGLEAGTVYIYSGYVKISASDDGINAAGGSDGSNNEGPGGFNPGGGGGFGPGGGRPGMNGGGTNPSQSSSDYSINVSGGTIYLDVEGDGYDSNGDINISGGTNIIWGAASNGRTADNSALDWGDWGSSCTISGGTVFAAGSRVMAEAPSTSGSCKCITISGTTRNKGEAINIVDGSGNALFSTYAVKAINHVIYASTALTTSNGSLSNVTDELLLEDGAVKPDSSSGNSSEGTDSGGDNINDDNNNNTEGNDTDNNGTGTNDGKDGNGSGNTGNSNGGNGSSNVGNSGNVGDGSSNAGNGNAGSSDSGAAVVSGSTSNTSAGTGNSTSGNTGTGNTTGSTADTSAASDSSDTKTVTVKGVTYTVSGKTAVISKAKKSVKNVTIPKSITIDGVRYKVTGIKNNAFAGCKKLESVIIGANVKSVGKNAFKGCKALKKIVFKGSKVPDIGTNAFKDINKNAVFTVNQKAKTGYKKKLFKNSAGYTKTWKIK